MIVFCVYNVASDRLVGPLQPPDQPKQPSIQSLNPKSATTSNPLVFFTFPPLPTIMKVAIGSLMLLAATTVLALPTPEQAEPDSGADGDVSRVDIPWTKNYGE